MSKFETVLFDCNHKAQFQHPIPDISDIVYCQSCKGYRQVIANSASPVIAFCTMGNVHADTANDPCYKIHEFASYEAALTWQRSHIHHTTIEERPI